MRPITELVDFNPKRAIKKGTVAPFIDMAALPVLSRDVEEITEKEFKSGGAKFCNGDTLFARITPCLENGKTAKVSGLERNQNGFGSTEFIVMSAKDREHDEDYVYYLARLPEFRAYAKARMEGTSGRQRVPWQSLAEFEYPMPSKEQRKRAGDFFRAIDNKISLNTKTNKTLEQMAQAIFKSWFVDFDPVKAKMNGEQPEGMDAATASLFPEKLVESELGLIPEGWEVGDLSDLMDFNPKRTLKKGTIAPYLDMKNMPTSGHLALDIYDREMGSGTKFKNGDSLLARITPCLENGKTAYVDFLKDEQVGWGSTEYIVMRSKSDSYKYFSYYMARFEPFRKFAIQSMTGTSGRQRAQAQTVQTMPFAIPPISILEKFDAFIAPNMQMIKSHGSENRTLANLRDTLLPKLLSGEIKLETNER